MTSEKKSKFKIPDQGSEDRQYAVPLRVAVAGSVDAGKSSFLGVLKSGEYDDGAGKARAHIFNYPHEIKTGRTSSVAQRSMMVENKKIIFFDLAGHEKYLRTTLYGMSSSYPHIALVLVEANRGVTKMTKEHIITCLYLRVPFAFVVTKLDIAQPHLLKKTVNMIKKLMKGQHKRVWDIKKQDDVTFAVQKLNANFIPLFRISNVCGDNYDPPFHYVPDYLHALNVNTDELDDTDEKESVFVIDKSFRAEGFPLIGSGYMRRGRIEVGQKGLYMGPFNGKLVPVSIRSMHDDNQTNVRFLRKNEMGCMSFKVKDDLITNKRQIHAGMIVTNNPNLKFHRRFIGRVEIFTTHHTTIKRRTNSVIHCGMVRKAVVIDDIYRVDQQEKDAPVQKLNCIRGGDHDVMIKFRFLQGVNFLEAGDLFMFREGKTRGSGVVTEVL